MNKKQLTLLWVLGIFISFVFFNPQRVYKTIHPSHNSISKDSLQLTIAQSPDRVRLFHDFLLNLQDKGKLKGIPTNFYVFISDIQGAGNLKKFYIYLKNNESTGNIQGVPDSYKKFTSLFKGYIQPRYENYSFALSNDIRQFFLPAIILGSLLFYTLRTRKT